MISFFELESQKLDELYDLKIKRKLSPSINVWLQATIEAGFELIGKNFNPNERNEEGITILQTIIGTGCLYLIEFLVEAGADVNAGNNDNEFPVQFAAYETKDIFNYIESLTSSQVKGLSLIDSTVNSEYEVIKALINSGINVDAYTEKGVGELNGRTPLIIAVQQGNLKMVKMFLEAGANPNLKDEDSGTTPLISAVRSQYVYMIRLLLENGADIKITDKIGNTPLEIALKLQTEKKLSRKKKLRNKKIIDLIISANTAKDKFRY